MRALFAAEFSIGCPHLDTCSPFVLMAAFARLRIATMKGILFLALLSDVGALAAEENLSNPAEMFPGRILNENGGWCWFQDELALFMGSCFLFSKNSPGRHGCSHVGYPSSAQTRTLAKKFNADAHAVAALLELPDGSVLSAWSSHGNAPVKKNNGAMFYATASRQAGFLEWNAV